METPVLRVRGGGSGVTKRTLRGNMRISVGWRGRTTEAFLGGLAHEFGHAHHRDPDAAPTWGDQVMRAVSAVPLVAFVAAALPLALAVTGQTQLVGGGWAPLVYFGLVVAGVLAWLGLVNQLVLWRERRRGFDRHVAELRADFIACRLVGRSRAIAARQEGAPKRPSRTDRMLYALIPSHPPLPLRIAAMGSYPLTVDPELAAREVITAWRAQGKPLARRLDTAATGPPGRP